MLTLAKIEVYRRFQGDIDAFQRSRLDPVAAGIEWDDWGQIDRIRTALKIVDGGLASPAFAAATEAELLAVTADEKSRMAIRELNR